MDNVKPQYQFLHSAYWNDRENSDAIIALLKDANTGDVKLKIVENPNRTIYVTKPGMQESHDGKKTYESLSNLDAYTVPNYRMRPELQKLLYGFIGGYATKKSLMNNPYVYGADIDISVLMKQHFLNNSTKVNSSFRVGGLDIETSMLGGKEVFHITYVSPELQVYTAVLGSFLKGFSEDEVNTNVAKQIAEFSGKLNKATKKIYNKYTLGITIERFETEIEMIKWIFSVIHKDKPEFISVWNINFDIPYLLDRCGVFGAPVNNIMCHPDVPSKYRVCEYHMDNNPKTQHFSHKWHVFELAGYSQFYDSMSLYSRLRRFGGVEDSYSLDAIAKKVTGVGKLEFDNENHMTMQTNRQVDYTAYNIVDSLQTVLIEKRVNDIPSMLMLIPDSDFRCFAMQSVQLKNWFYNYCRAFKRVPASWQGRVLHETDELIENTGGNVLQPGLSWRAGVTRVKEFIGIAKDLVSKLCILVCDLDVISFYPSAMSALNISKETKVLTILKIEGFSVRSITDFCGHLVSPRENAVYLCNKFLNLPSYKEMLSDYDNSID